MRLWRVGRHLGRTIYEIGTTYGEDDRFLGIMDSAADAAYVVRLHNDNLAVGGTAFEVPRSDQT